MGSRLLASSIRQRTSKVLAASALALGLAAAVLAPSSALAAPGQASRPDLTTGYWFTGKLKPGQRWTIPVQVRNDGAPVGGTVEVQFVIGSGFRNITIQGHSGEGWSCGTIVRNPISDNAVVTCRTWGLVASHDKWVDVTGTAVGTSEHWMIAEADPDDDIAESDETNNGPMLNF